MVKLPHDIDHQIRFALEKAYPEEGCGLLLGSFVDSIYYVRDIVEVANGAGHDRSQRYLISPAHYRAGERIAAEKHLSIIGAFHSHPDHEPYPTPYDVEQAHPRFAYIIAAVDGRRSGMMTSWVLDENRRRFEQHTLEISR